MTFHPDSLPNLSGKVFILTGGTAGLGYHTTLHLLRHSARVYITARSPTKATQTLQTLRTACPSADIHILSMDNTSLSTVRTAVTSFLAQETHLHGLINNAGIMTVPYSLTKDGHQVEWQTNYLAHWLFTYLLLPTMLATSKNCQPGEVRIVNLTSSAHWRAPWGGVEWADPDMKEKGLKGECPTWAPYAQSKLGNILHAKVLNEKYGPGSQSALTGKGEIWSASLHPGLVHTNLIAVAGSNFSLTFNFWKLLGSTHSPEEACATPLYCIASEEFTAEVSGRYFTPGPQLGLSSLAARHMGIAKRLEEYTEGLMRSEGWID